jgi:hypothetical protein
MQVTAEDMIASIRICLASIEGQRSGPSAETLKTYLDGYEAACKMLLEIIEKKKAL